MTPRKWTGPFGCCWPFALAVAACGGDDDADAPATTAAR